MGSRTYNLSSSTLHTHSISTHVLRQIGVGGEVCIIPVLGKAVSYTQAFAFHSDTEERALGLEHFLPKRERVHTTCARLITLHGSVSPCCKLNECSFVLVKHAGQWP